MNAKLLVSLPLLTLTLVSASARAEEGSDAVAEKTKPRVKVGFVYTFCNDLASARHFYTDLIGLPEAAYDEEHRYLCYQNEGFQLMFFRPDQEVAPPPGWADQPGYGGGTAYVTSWSIEVPETEYAVVVARLREAGVESHGDVPDWRVDSYWGFTVKDPAGNTVEVYTIPPERPASTTWPGE